MVDMTHHSSAHRLGTEFDNFLFAPIGEDGNGMSLSVVSALARLDIDPWAEAAELAKLSGALAVLRLTRLIEALPGDGSTHANSKTVAARLVTLLPRFGGSGVPHRSTAFGGSVVTEFRPLMFAYVAIAVVYLGSQWILPDHRSPPHVASAHAPVAGAPAPKSLPPNWVR